MIHIGYQNDNYVTRTDTVIIIMGKDPNIMLMCPICDEIYHF